MGTPPVDSTKAFLRNSMKTSLTPCRRIGLGRPRSGSLNRPFCLRSVNTPEQNITPIVKEVKSVNFISDKTPTLDCKSRLKSPLRASDVLNKCTAPRVRRCLTTWSKTPSKHTAKKVLSDSESEICNISGDLKSGSRENENYIDKSSNMSNKRVVNLKLAVGCGDEMEKGNQIQVSYNSVTPAVSSEYIVEENTQDITSEMILQLTLSIKEKKERLEQLKVQESYAKKHNLSELRSLTAKWKTAGQEALRYSMSLARQAGYSVTLTQLMDQHGFPPDLIGYNAEDDEFD